MSQASRLAWDWVKQQSLHLRKIRRLRRRDTFIMGKWLASRGVQMDPGTQVLSIREATKQSGKCSWQESKTGISGCRSPVSIISSTRRPFESSNTDSAPDDILTYTYQLSTFVRSDSFVHAQTCCARRLTRLRE